MSVRLRWLVCALVVLFCFRPVRAHAHAIGASRGDYAVSGNDVTIVLTLARGEVASLASPIETTLAAGVRVANDGNVCPTTYDAQQLVEEDGLVVRLHARCAQKPEKVAVDLALLDQLSHGHRHFAHLASSAVHAAVLFRGASRFEFAAAEASVGAPPRPSSGVWALFTMGAEHILSIDAYDHILFLFGLVLVGGRIRSLVAVVTAFTIGHSISLAIATFGVFTPSPRVIEPLIALSIAYVGLENLWVAAKAKSDAQAEESWARKRWRITLPFGVVHGFGFAGKLAEISLSRAEIPKALLLFNVGVEVGQLVVLAVFVPLLLLARRAPVFRTRGVQALSAGILLAGLVWAVMRVVKPGS